jgi:hypothetical protein
MFELDSFTQIRNSPLGVALSLPSRPLPVETSVAKIGTSPSNARSEIDVDPSLARAYGGRG